MSLAEKIDSFLDFSNEVSFGYNDSGAFWHFHYGGRGTGNMMEGFGKTFNCEPMDFEESVDAFIEHLRSTAP